MIAVILNGLATSLGAVLGIFLKRAISEKQTQALLYAVALCVAVMGIQGAVKSENMLLLLGSMVIGTLVGTALGIEDGMQRLGEAIKSRIGANSDSMFLQGFLLVSVVQVVGAMSILGPVQAALLGDNSLLYFKCVLDGCSAFIFGSIYGKGIIPVGLVVAVYEMAFFFLAQVVSPLMTPDVIRELNAVGNVMIIAISLNILGLMKLKVADYLPALFIPIIYYYIVPLLP